YDTAVVPEHRGRRIGIWVKAAMLDWLAGTRPGVREIETDNAGDNVHMLAVNEELGFRVERESMEYQAPVAALPAAPCRPRPDRGAGRPPQGARRKRACLFRRRFGTLLEASGIPGSQRNCRNIPLEFDAEHRAVHAEIRVRIPAGERQEGWEVTR